jgi:hypothetical protein
MLNTLLTALSIEEAEVSATPATGEVHVRRENGEEVSCQLLETSSATPLVLAIGDRVLAAFPTEDTGYIVGRVTPHHPAPPSDGRAVQVVAPDGVETIRISGRTITIAADDSLVLECGGGSVRIDKRGKVVVLGTDITSRAKRLHKVKGASVAIN